MELQLYLSFNNYLSYALPVEMVSHAYLTNFLNAHHHVFVENTEHKNMS